MGEAGHSSRNVKPPVDMTDAKVRICLRCDKAFDSTNRGNRICPRCRSRKIRG